MKNPFRYRSYYFDVETGLYYLNSRYYDPETGRFINADDVSTLEISQVAQNGLNLYAYCLNNPVNDTDNTGYLPDSFTDILDAVCAFLEFSIATGLALVSWAIIKGARPINIGLGTFLKNQTKNLSNISKATNILSKISTIVSIISVSINIIDGIINDINSNLSVGHIISNILANTLIYGGTTFAAGFIGAKIGALLGSAVPGLGNAIGAAVGFLAGIAFGWLFDIKIKGKSIGQHIKDGFYKFWRWLFG